MLRKAFFLSTLSLGLFFLVEGSQVLRERSATGDEQRLYVEEEAGFRLDLKVKGLPRTIEDGRGKSRVQAFQMDLQHRRGVRLPASKIQPGDFLLEPLVLLGPDGERFDFFPAGHRMTSEDFVYLKSDGFRMMYDEEGIRAASEELDVGDVLDVYTMQYDESNRVEFSPSGFLNVKGETIIPNGVTLTKRHLAMLRTYTALPVRIRHEVELDLEAYLRVDWPKAQALRPRQFWVMRDGEPQAMRLYSYQILPGDRPLMDIIGKDDKVICAADTPLLEKGPKNSIEVLDGSKTAVMLSQSKLPIYSVDPITGDANDVLAEPGELVLAPSNVGDYVSSSLMKTDADIEAKLADESGSFCRSFGDKEAELPFEAHLTRYPVPLYHPCLGACDAEIQILDDVMKSEVDCDACDQQIEMRPYVWGEVPAYPYLDSLWTNELISCSICDEEFSYRGAHAMAGAVSDMVEIDHPIAANFVHPSRIRNSRLGDQAFLERDVHYYKNGEEVTVPAGTLADDELRYRLEDRAVSPVYLKGPEGGRGEAAQCPRCFAWNLKPTQFSRLKGQMGLDEVRRAVACFPIVEGRVNRLDLVVFGLSSEVDEVSGWSMAKVITFRRYGDEHFNHIQGWRETESRWAFLPKYQHQSSFFKPVALKSNGGGRRSNQEELFEDDF
jgi:hypothetical protein